MEVLQRVPASLQEVCGGSGGHPAWGRPWSTSYRRSRVLSSHHPLTDLRCTLDLETSLTHLLQVPCRSRLCKAGSQENCSLLNSSGCINKEGVNAGQKGQRAGQSPL